MSLASQNFLRILLADSAPQAPDEGRLQNLERLLQDGFCVSVQGDARALAPEDQHPLLVLGNYEVSQPDDGHSESGTPVHFRNIRGQDPEQVSTIAAEVRDQSQAVKQGEWKPWFPVIDYDRCTNCMQCLSFCLFDVYGVDEEQKIQVQNNDNCKTNCPACSRVCPEAAIMFPKYKAGPINGDLVSANDLNREKMKIDISSLLGGDVYQMLRDRSDRAQSRFSKERDSGKALGERQKCLTKLAQAGDIPEEVLLSLPSPEEIARKAEAAAEKARRALEAQKS